MLEVLKIIIGVYTIGVFAMVLLLITNVITLVRIDTRRRNRSYFERLYNFSFVSSPYIS